MSEPIGTPRPWRTRVIQLVGFLIGIALLAYVVRLALNEDNREGLRQLGEASPASIAALLAVTAIGLTASGVQFWLVLRPIRRLNPLDVLSTNYIAILLSYLPFKLSVMFRLAIHKGRDGIPLAIIGPWFGAIGIVLLIPTLPIVILADVRPVLDAIGLATVAGMTVLLTAATATLATRFGQGRGLARARALADRQPIGIIKRLVRSETFERFDESLGMLASFRHGLLLMSIRVIDIAAFAGRFYIVSRMLGEPMDFGACVIASAVYFFIGVFSPIGSLGAREAGTAGAFALFNSIGLDLSSGIDHEQVAVISVVVTGAELLVSLTTAALGIAWLRPDRLLRAPKNKTQPTTHAETATPNPTESAP